MVPKPQDLTPITESEAAAEARRLIAAVEEIYHQPPPAPIPTSFRDETPSLPSNTAPVAQDGRPPMSQTATDISGVVLSVGIASLPIGGMTSLVLYTLGGVDPVTLAIAVGAPVAFVGALARVVKRVTEVRQAAPPEHHHHYQGTVIQDHSSITTTTRGMIARTTNDLHR